MLKNMFLLFFGKRFFLKMLWAISRQCFVYGRKLDHGDSSCSYQWWCCSQLHHHFFIYDRSSCKVRKPWDDHKTCSDLAQKKKGLGDIKDEHSFCDEAEWNFMLMEWMAWSPDRATQECSWPHSERGCVIMWAKWTIPTSSHEGNEFLSTNLLLR